LQTDILGKYVPYKQRLPFIQRCHGNGFYPVTWTKHMTSLPYTYVL